MRVQRFELAALVALVLMPALVLLVGRRGASTGPARKLMLAVVIGLFGNSVGATAQALARRRELGMLQHLGMPRRQLQQTLAIEGAVVGALGALAGILTGAVMSVILVHVINRQSFHWSMEMHVPWWPLLGLAIVLTACAAVTAAVSERRALGDQIVRAVKEDR